MPIETNEDSGRMKQKALQGRMMRDYQSTLLGRTDVAEGTMAFQFEKPHDFVFKAGQYIDLTISESHHGSSNGLIPGNRHVPDVQVRCDHLLLFRPKTPCNEHIGLVKGIMLVRECQGKAKRP